MSQQQSAYPECRHILTNGRNQRFINSVEISSLEGQNSILFAINQVVFALTAGGE